MAFSMLCPRCRRKYRLRPEMMGKEVRCACGQAFMAPVSPSQPAPGPAPLAASPRGPLDDLFAESFGPSASPDLLAAGGLESSGPLAGTLTSYRRRRMTSEEVACLAAGAGLAALGFACLVVLFRLLDLTAIGWMAAAVVLMLSGAGLVVYSQRRNLLVALPVGTAIVCLAVVGLVARPLPKSSELVAEECLRASQEFVAAMESIHDEETLRQARPKVLDALGKLLHFTEEAKRKASQGQQVSPETERKMNAAGEDIRSRTEAATRRLVGIPGGKELVQDIARTFKDAQQRLAAIPNPSPSAAASGPQVLSPQLRQELKDLGVCFHQYIDQHQSESPRNWESFEQFLRDRPASVAVLRTLRAEGWVFHWGVDLARCTVGTSNFVLAHGKDAPDKGGAILYMDGACTSLTAEEIRQRLTAQAPLEPSGQGLTFMSPSPTAGAPPAQSGPPPGITGQRPLPAPSAAPSQPDDEPPPSTMPSGGFDVGPSKKRKAAAPAEPDDEPPPSRMRSGGFDVGPSKKRKAAPPSDPEPDDEPPPSRMPRRGFDVGPPKKR